MNPWRLDIGQQPTVIDSLPVVPVITRVCVVSAFESEEARRSVHSTGDVVVRQFDHATAEASPGADKEI